jgi:hypothetical protein
VQNLYDGLTEYSQSMVDASYGGTFMLKSEYEAWVMFENLSNNSRQQVSILMQAMMEVFQKLMWHFLAKISIINYHSQ